MKTTIQISQTTRQLLASLQEQSGKSCDQILHELLKEQMKIPDSLAGAYPRLEWNKETDRMKFRGE